MLSHLGCGSFSAVGGMSSLAVVWSSLPMKRVVRKTYHTNMTLAVYLGHKSAKSRFSHDVAYLSHFMSLWGFQPQKMAGGLKIQI